MKPSAILGLALASLGALMGSDVLAQESFADVNQRARRSHQDYMPVLAGLSEIAPFGHQWSVNTFFIFYRNQGPDRIRFWAIRREVGGHDGSTGVTWADSRTCPEVETTLIGFENLPPVHPYVIGLGGEDPQVAPAMDDSSYTAWSHFAASREPPAHFEYEITGGSRSPVATWWHQSLGAMQDCWTEAPPA